MTPAPTPPSKIPAWVCAPGVLKVPFLAEFLPGYDLRALPGPEVKAVIGWGMKPTAAAGRTYAAKRGLSYVALEDGFLRSVGLGEAGATSLSVIADDLGVYYDAHRPSRMEDLIRTAPDWCDAAMTARARALIDRIVASGVSKTNMGVPLDPSILKPGRRVLVVDQTLGDASIAYGLASPAAFAEMIAAARRDEPDAQLIVKRHPAVAAGRKQGCIVASDLIGVTVIDTDVRAADLLAVVDAVYVVTSALGFEALLRGLPVRCFGAPFYSGWGPTTDAIETGRRGGPRSVEQIAAAALIVGARYVDPVTGRRCEAEAALGRLIALRNRADRLSGVWAAAGFAPAKRPPIRRLLNSPKGSVRYHWFARNAAKQAEVENGRLIWWAGKESDPIRAAAAATIAPTVRMEDGFIRSRGLGSDFHGALSVALDDQGVYYDATRPNRLESLIQAGGLDDASLARSARLRARIVEAGLSKYNIRGEAPVGWPSDRERVLVVGQVENDKSIALGCTDIRTNSGLVEAARRDFPDAFLIYRNHPDVMAGNRPGLLDAHALDAVDAVADDLDIIDCLNACDRLVTLTSLSGFEALMRGKAVTTYGRPFYAGWGLTDDRTGPFPRRTTRATLDALIHAALIDYPIYVSPTGWPCEAEDLVDALIAARDHPVPPGPRGVIPRWWRGIMASLDGKPPPSY
ncbi:capsular polysaccharide biosynthesis protein [Brevundimonas sp.]|uniref:capsular polysaccharide biosynthesis protein n=1 Tax=Brevundimonas sp. TaxID=1871086 RepID=UPI0025C5B5CA|nr:capsular polysaccharide biosynthesis protein [Brevundimonas sp.]